MTKFAVFDADGSPLGFYAEDIHGSRRRPVYGPTPRRTRRNSNPVPPVIGDEANPDCTIPADAVEISDEDWQGLLSNPGRRWRDGRVVDVEPPSSPTDITMASVRAQRNDLLSKSDWTQLPDAPVDRERWAIYRQQLRDLPETVDPSKVQWPLPPDHDDTNAAERELDRAARTILFDGKNT